MPSVIETLQANQKKAKVADVRSGDTVKVHQRIREGSKERIQIFQGLVIRVDRKKSLTSRITVRRVASGVGVEKSFLLHSPLVEKVEIVKRSKVRRNYLSYMRQRTGKSARMSSVAFDSQAVNVSDEPALEESIDSPENASSTEETPETATSAPDSEKAATKKS